MSLHQAPTQAEARALADRLASGDALTDPERVRLVVILRACAFPRRTSSAPAVQHVDARGRTIPDEDLVMAAILQAAAKEPPNTLIPLRRVRELARLSASAFDVAVLALARAGRVVLHHHDHGRGLKPEERRELVYDVEQDIYYVGVAPRRAGAAPFAERFDAAFAALDRASGEQNNVAVHALRAALPDVSREVFDAEVKALLRRERYTAHPAAGRQVSQAEREAGLLERGGLLPLVYVARRTDAKELRAFADRVIAAAQATPVRQRWGEHKVFIADLWPAVGGSLAAFKARLLEARRAGLVTLSRADLVSAMPAGKVERSDTRYPGEHDSDAVHFVRLEE